MSRRNKIVLICVLLLMLVCCCSIVFLIQGTRFMPVFPNPFGDLKTIPTMQAELRQTQDAMATAMRATLDSRAANAVSTADLGPKLTEFAQNLQLTMTARVPTATPTPLTTPTSTATLTPEVPTVWVFVKDLGIKDVPGVGNRTVAKFATEDGSWKKTAYCLQPGDPIPPKGRKCTYSPNYFGRGEGLFDCGNKFQTFHDMP